VGPETDGVLARYEIGAAVVQLLLVQYPKAGAASAGLAALERGQVSTLVAAFLQRAPTVEKTGHSVTHQQCLFFGQDSARSRGLCGQSALGAKRYAGQVF